MRAIAGERATSGRVECCSCRRVECSTVCVCSVLYSYCFSCSESIVGRRGGAVVVRVNPPPRPRSVTSTSLSSSSPLLCSAMATPRATAEVLPLFTPGSLSPLRIFLSLAVLLLFLLLALFAPKKVKKGPKGSRTILLVGPLASGKTALFSKVQQALPPNARPAPSSSRALSTLQLLYGAAPATHTSIKENEGIVKACWSDAVGGKSEQLQLEKDTPPAAVSVGCC